MRQRKRDQQLRQRKSLEEKQSKSGEIGVMDAEAGELPEEAVILLVGDPEGPPQTEKSLEFAVTTSL